MLFSPSQLGLCCVRVPTPRTTCVALQVFPPTLEHWSWGVCGPTVLLARSAYYAWRYPQCARLASAGTLVAYPRGRASQCRCCSWFPRVSLVACGPVCCDAPPRPFVLYTSVAALFRVQSLHANVPVIALGLCDCGVSNG